MTLQIAPQLPTNKTPQSAGLLLGTQMPREVAELVNQYSELVSRLNYQDFRSLIGALNDIRTVFSKLDDNQKLVMPFDAIGAADSPLDILAEYGLPAIKNCLESLRARSRQTVNRLAVDAALLARISCKDICGVNMFDPSNPAATLGSNQIIQIHVERCAEYIEISPGQNPANESHVKIRNQGNSSSACTLKSGQSLVSGRKLQIIKLFGQFCDLQDSLPLGPVTVSQSWSRGSVLIKKLPGGDIALFDRGTKLPLTVKAFHHAAGIEEKMSVHFSYSGKRGNDGKPGNTYFFKS